MDLSFKPPNFFRKKNIKSHSPSIQGSGQNSARGKNESFAPPSYRNDNTLVKGKGKANGRLFFGPGARRLTHHSDSVGMKTSTVDTVSDSTVVESKSYIRSYSPYLDDDISSETSTASIRIASEETVPTASTGVTQQVEMRGLEPLVSGDEDDDTNSDVTAYESAAESPHEASIVIRHFVYVSCIGQEETAEHIDDIDDHDLARSIKGFYRILDLIAEQGSGGLGSTCILVLCSALTAGLYQWTKSLFLRLLFRSLSMPFVPVLIRPSQG